MSKREKVNSAVDDFVSLLALRITRSNLARVEIRINKDHQVGGN